MPRKKKDYFDSLTWEELLDSLVAKEAPPESYYFRARERIREYVYGLKAELEDFEHQLEEEQAYSENLRNKITDYNPDHWMEE